MAQVSYPGVYVREEASGARAIAGVATSIAAFVGMAERGPLNTPVRIFNFADFERSFGPTTDGELATQVRNFYLNGGGEAYVMRIADSPVQADVTLLTPGNANAMTVTARDPGLEGNMLRVEIDYDTGSPEETFNLTVYRSVLRDDGTTERQAEETFPDLSMNPNAGNFADAAINGNSALITVKAVTPPNDDGVSIAGAVLRSAANDAKADLDGLVTASANSLTLTVGDNRAVPVTLTAAADPTIADLAALIAQWNLDLNTALTDRSITDTVTLDVPAETVAAGGTGANRLLRIRSSDGPVRVTPAAANDCTVALHLGTAQGGIEGSRYGDGRPAPSGVVARMGSAADEYAAFRSFAGTNRDQLTTIDITDDSDDSPHPTINLNLGGAAPMFDDGSSQTLGNVLMVLDTVRGLIADGTNGRWRVDRHGMRLAMTPLYGTENAGRTAAIASGTYDLADPAFLNAGNTAVYKLGTVGGVAGPSPFQAVGPDAPTPGDNGNPPRRADYAAAYTIIDRDVDLFNLLLLPRNKGQSNTERKLLWGPASSFCQKKRAFLLVDPDDDWDTITKAESGVNTIRIGVATQNAACYWPRLDAGGKTFVDPCGAIAGVMARTDGNRGVWKAPAGLEASIRGVSGVKHQMTDPENGVINPKALNAIRLFPAGVVSWGARTLVGFDGSGNVDDKYIPVRRTMLMIEESLYRGLRFAVFEPNDEPLWAQIRLAAGSYMNGLFRQGAFAGAKSTDAYFVQCDSSTTTPNDINLGIVNVVVGFAPLKPAEFVVLTVKQIAGQVQV